MKTVMRMLACALTLGLVLTACGQKVTETAEKTQGDGYFGEPFEFSVMMTYTMAQQETSPYLESYIQDLLGCKINYIKAPQTSWEEKLTTTLASANFPDLIYMAPGSALKWYAQDAIIPLNDLMEEYGKDMCRFYTPTDIAEITDIDQEIIYCLRGVNPIKEMHSIGIRQDWLDKLGLKTPDTIEQWRATLTAFKNNADKLGVSRVIPWAGSLTPFYNAFGIMASGDSVGYNGLYTLDDSGNYMLKYDHPNFRKALETIRSFYQDGLIDQEYIARKDMTAIYELFNNGSAGAGQVYASRLREITQILQKTGKDAMFKNILPIQSADGRRMITGRDRYTTGASISVKADKAGKSENIMKFLNFFFTDDGIRLYNYGIEGTHHTMIDGKPVLVEPYNQGWIELRKQGINPVGQMFIWEAEAYKQSLLNGKALDQANELDRLVYDGLYDNSEYCYTPLKSFITPMIEERGTDVFGALSELEARTIIGEITVEQFFEEYEKLKKSGLSQIQSEITEYWSKYQQILKNNND